jgi:hypothetical protein
MYARTSEYIDYDRVDHGAQLSTWLDLEHQNKEGHYAQSQWRHLKTHVERYFPILLLIHQMCTKMWVETLCLY